MIALSKEDKEKIRIFAGSSSKELAKKIAEYLEIDLSSNQIVKFADGETFVKSNESVRGCKVFIIQSTSKPVNESLMELLIFIDALRRASAREITAVIPYYGYARQDRKAAGRQPISARLVADLLQTAGASKIIAIDLHNPSIQGFFNIPVDDLRGQFIFGKELKNRKDKFVIVSPDHGGAVRARQLSELLQSDDEIAIIDKRRTGPNKSEIMGVLGNVADKNVVIYDDIIDTGGTILHAVEALKEQGAKKIIVAATHGLFSKGFDMFENDSNVTEVIVTDSTNLKNTQNYKKLRILSLDEFLGKVIEANINKTSITEVYNDYIRQKK